MRFRRLLSLFGVLLVLYIIWGSTCFVIRIGVESWPPSMMTGARSLAAGILLMVLLLLRGYKLPPLRPLLDTALIGLLLLAVGNGMVTVAGHQNVPSDIAAIVVATVLLFTLCFSRLPDIKMCKLEWVGITIGLAGTITLNSGGSLSGNPWGVILILIGSISWALGPACGPRITLPVGMMAGAIKMLVIGVVLMTVSMAASEKLTALPSLSGFLAVGYLTLLGSTIATNTYTHLIRNVSLALTISYAYVNPMVVVLLGTGSGGETSSKIEWLALDIIVFVMVLVTLGKYLSLAKPVVVPAIQDTSSE